MLEVVKFTFNPFQENTYILFNEFKHAIIIDPGMYNSSEQSFFIDYINEHQLIPKLLLNTHCHIDHIFSNTFISEKYNLPLHIHPKDLSTLQMGATSATLYNLNYYQSVEPTVFLKENTFIELDNDKLKILYTPGHSSGSVSFYCEEDSFVIAGDVLFHESIGRTDLPGGNFEVLSQSIKNELYTLNNNTVVFCGHGDETTIGHEKEFNPFVKA